MFYNQLIKICEKRNIKPTPLMKRLGLSAGNLKRWQEGASVNSEILLKLSDYFGVPVDYFFGSKHIMKLYKKEVRSMLKFYDKFIELCVERGVKPTPTLKEIGVSAGNMKRWKNGSAVNAETLEKVAAYFGVPVGYFFEGEEISLNNAQPPTVIDTMTAIKMFTEKFKEQYGKEEKMESGDKEVAVFDNCTMIVSKNENNEVTTSFIGGKPLEIDAKLDLFVE